MLRPRKPTSGGSVAINYEQCPAKSFESPSGAVQGHSVFDHCQIVGEVAKELIRRSTVAAMFPIGSAFTVGSHDVGKISPTFYNKIMKACGLPQIAGVNPDLERNWGGHAGVSQLTARQLGASKYVPEILGQHHGFSPPVAGMLANDEVFGGPDWQGEREKMLKALEHAFGETWPKVSSLAQARLLAGLTSVADWIGSGPLFEDPQTPWQENIQRAVDNAGFIPPTYKKGLSFTDIFGFAPREAQKALIKQITTPGVYVLEAPMGLGKTEAALYAAYQMLEKGQASGISV